MLFKKDNFMWDFQALSIDQYALMLKIPANGKTFDIVFNASLKALSKVGIVNKEIDKLNSFKVYEGYNKYLHTKISKFIKTVSKELEKDKIFISTSSVDYAQFDKIKDNWTISIKIKGVYVDKR